MYLSTSCMFGGLFSVCVSNTCIYFNCGYIRSCFLQTYTSRSGISMLIANKFFAHLEDLPRLFRPPLSHPNTNSYQIHRDSTTILLIRRMKLS